MEKMSAVERADAVNEIRLLASIKFDYSQCLVHVLQRACWLLRGCWQPSNAAQFFMSHEQWREAVVRHALCMLQHLCAGMRTCAGTTRRSWTATICAS